MHVVGGEQHGDTFLAVQRLHEIAQRELGDRIEPDGRLVEEENTRAVEQGGRDLAAHALAERELAQRRVQDRRDLQHLDKSFAGRGECRLLDAIDVAQQLEALDHRQVPPQLRALAEHHADPRHMGDAAFPRHQPADVAMAGARAQDSRQDLDGGRFARAVRTDEAEQLAFRERETHLVERHDVLVLAPEQAANGARQARIARRNAVDFAEILDLYLGHRSRSPKRSPRRTGNPATVSTRQI